MDNENLSAAKAIIPQEYHNKIQLFADDEIKDPYYGGEEGFGDMFQEIEISAQKYV